MPLSRRQIAGTFSSPHIPNAITSQTTAPAGSRRTRFSPRPVASNTPLIFWGGILVLNASSTTEPSGQGNSAGLAGNPLPISQTIVKASMSMVV
jgi:hypothetical protein